ncbi:sorting nexin-16 [Odontesthes bonariensis]|uniref:sorting nexin-16 n=1 Tax=Odontesthes bonariensis TaxID=219752 RepID=UPI003F585A8C
MAVPFVPVPVPVDWCRVSRNSSKRGSSNSNPLSRNCEPLPLENNNLGRRHRPCSAAVGWMAMVETWKRLRGDGLNGSCKSLEYEENSGESWEERSIVTSLLGYEILEERAKFTVYKILVRGCHGNSWVIFRRYTDFCRLSDKLKELFPSFCSALPPKCCFKNNYKDDFLEERQLGLQSFLQDLMLDKNVFTSESVRHFLSLGNLPSPFDSLEESRAFCETLEETNHRLQRELLVKKSEADTLRKTLEERENHFNLLLKKLRPLSLSSGSFEGSCETTNAIDTRKRDMCEWI